MLTYICIYTSDDFFKEMSYPILVLLYADCHKSLLVKILSIPWLMMLWLLASPGHQQPWSWQCTKLEQHLPPHDNIGHKHLWNDIWCRLLLWWHRYKVWQRWARIFEAPDEKPGKPKASCECCKMKKNQENNFQWNIFDNKKQLIDWWIDSCSLLRNWKQEQDKRKWNHKNIM